jgi:hypothetical protein
MIGAVAGASPSLAEFPAEGKQPGRPSPATGSAGLEPEAFCRPRGAGERVDRSLP